MQFHHMQWSAVVFVPCIHVGASSRCTAIAPGSAPLSTAMCNGVTPPTESRSCPWSAIQFRTCRDQRLDRRCILGLVGCLMQGGPVVTVPDVRVSPGRQQGLDHGRITLASMRNASCRGVSPNRTRRLRPPAAPRSPLDSRSLSPPCGGGCVQSKAPPVRGCQMQRRKLAVLSRVHVGAAVQQHLN